MSGQNIERCCGTCRFWIVDQTSFEERLRTRVSPQDPTCRHNGKYCLKDNGKGCLGWKKAEPWDLGKRGYNLDEGGVECLLS